MQSAAAKRPRAAGDELAVSHTVVSRHLRNLKEWLGVKLVEPSGRGLVLTREGALYHAKIGRAFEAIARATVELRPTARQALPIWCFPGLANRRLLARLPELEALLPDWEITCIRRSRDPISFAARLTPKWSISTNDKAPTGCAPNC